MYIAHIRESDHSVQTVRRHLLETKQLAESFGAKIGVRHLSGLAAMLHDMGKYTKAFRAYLIQAVRNPDAPPRRGSVDHSTAGGKLLFELFHNDNSNPYLAVLAEVIGNAIISHHSYLHDFVSPANTSPFLQRVRDKVDIPEYEQAKHRFFSNVMDETSFRKYAEAAAAELQAFLQRTNTETTESKLLFLTKFIFSTLIDADRTNTSKFEEEESISRSYDHISLMEACYTRLINKLSTFQPTNEREAVIHKLRGQMSEQCERHALERPSGIYTLSIPTGGGKTLASFRYALKHAIATGKKRIVYIIPYTTIIEQNADELRRLIADDEHLLEHHSNLVDDMDDDEALDGRVTFRQKMKLAKDNWDVPIVMTTMVQFLNAFYAYGTRNIRRLHNLCEAVIIFDEVQKVPLHCVSLFNRALNFLKTYGQSSLILCTATQPALDYVEHKLAINAEGEMISHLEELIQAFERVRVIDRATDETFTTEKLCHFVKAKLLEVRSVLVILNTKSVVRKLYQRLTESSDKQSVPVYHLSTAMCPAHRKHILEIVKKHLHNGKPVVCVSTQLIEAGVDVSFDCVIRSLAGLDSIAQAAGRCNRHGRNGIQDVYVIDHAEEDLGHLEEIREGKEVARKILIDLKLDGSAYGGKLLSQQAMERYFTEFYDKCKGRLDYFINDLRQSMITLLMSRKKDHPYANSYKILHGTLPLYLVNSYGTAAEYFHVIENDTKTVLVPYERGKEIIAGVNGYETIADLTRTLRQAQQYAVQLYPHEWQRLDQNKGLVTLFDGNLYALKESAYSKEYGVLVDNDGKMETALF